MPETRQSDSTRRPPSRSLRPSASHPRRDGGTRTRLHQRLVLTPRLGAAAAGLWVFFRERRKTADPRIPPALLRQGRGAYLAVTAILGDVRGGYVYFNALYLQEVMRFDPLTTGFAALSATGSASIVSTQIARRTLPRLGSTGQLAVAFALMGIGQFYLSLRHDGSTYLGGIVPGTVLTASRVRLPPPAEVAAITSTVSPT